MKWFIALSLTSLPALANTIQLKDYDWAMTDITSKGLSKETLFNSMDRKFIRPSKSICSNRALMWANDFKRIYDLDTAKIFLFYTKKKDDESLKTWWYHVAPVVNERGNIFVLDAGFAGWITSPMTTISWLAKFAESTNCKEINANETELVELIFRAQVFPHETRYGHHDCYFKIVPHPFWTPEIVAQNLLGRNSEGRPVQVERPEIIKEELYQACLEATAGKLGWVLGSSKEACKDYIKL
jgi:hypothetical protein